MAVAVCVFDAYGTLFDVGAAARDCAAETGRDAFAARWADVAETWRQKQLAYTWLRALAGDHADFWTVTQDALDFALEAHKLDGDTGLRDRLLKLYFELSAYLEVPDVLSKLKDQGLALAILSNGEPKMLAAAVSSASVADRFDAVLSVETVGVFKPHPSVYELVTTRFGCAREEVAFVSSNGWDAAAAARFGFYAIWVNRRGEPVDRLPGRPAEVLTDLSALPARVAARAAG